MTRAALESLLAKVEAGEASTMGFEDAGFDGWAELAYNGSLDAALSLHEAVLPGWVARPQIGGEGAGVSVWHCTIEDWDGGDEISANNQPDPARAWLIAIIRAMLAEGE